jgi:hypothetical protein
MPSSTGRMHVSGRAAALLLFEVWGLGVVCPFLPCLYVPADHCCCAACLCCLPVLPACAACLCCLILQGKNLATVVKKLTA